MTTGVAVTAFVFVHGRGDQGSDVSDWRQPLRDHLTAAGVPTPVIDGDQWIELRYDDLLRNHDRLDGSSWPSRPSVPINAIAEYAARNAPLRELAVKPKTVGHFDVLNRGIRGAVWFLLAPRGIPVTIDLQDWLVKRMEDVARFATDEGLRQAVVHRLLEQMPDGDVVLVGHSLGSVAVLEMLPYLPSTTTVRLLITIGSPAALDQLQEHTNLAGARSPFPADRVKMWLNLVNPGDPVCLGAGLRARFSMVTDHRIQPTWSHEWSHFHGARTYLAEPIVSRALEIAVPTDRSPMLFAPRRSGGSEAMLPSYISVAYASALAEAAKEGRHRERCRRIIARKLLPAITDADGRETSIGDINLEVGAWVAAERPRAHRLMILLHAATSDPFAPFEPGLTTEDREAGLRQLASLLGLGGQDAEDISGLLEVCAEVARNEKKTGFTWKKLLVGVGVTVATAAAAPLAVGAFAAAGATGAAAMTSGLAALGTGGMGGGLTTLAALSAGAGIIGGQLAGSAPTQQLMDEALVAQDLASRAAMVRLLRGIDDDEAQTAADQELTRLKALRDDLKTLSRDHRKYSSSDSVAARAVQSNLDRTKEVLRWLDTRVAVDRRRSGRPPYAMLPEPPNDSPEDTENDGG